MPLTKKLVPFLPDLPDLFGPAFAPVYTGDDLKHIVFFGNYPEVFHRHIGIVGVIVDHKGLVLSEVLFHIPKLGAGLLLPFMAALPVKMPDQLPLEGEFIVFRHCHEHGVPLKGKILLGCVEDGQLRMGLPCSKDLRILSLKAVGGVIGMARNADKIQIPAAAPDDFFYRQGAIVAIVCMYMKIPFDPFSHIRHFLSALRLHLPALLTAHA